MFLSSPGPADVPRAAEKSVCGKGQCLHYTPRLPPPPHVHHLPGRHEGGGPGTQGSKVALENCMCLRQHTNTSECLHLVGNSHPISCPIRTTADGSCDSKAGAIQPVSAFPTAVLHSFYTPAPHKTLGNYKKLFCTAIHCFPHSPLSIFSLERKAG